MAKFLQDLLQADSPLFATAMQNLERAAGRDGVDVRLIADIITRAHAVMRTLGLDPADTTELELYRALSARSSDDEIFADTEFVGLVYSGSVISFHQHDVQDNVGVVFEDRSTAHMQQALQHELVRRYSFHERTDDRTVEQFARDAGLKVWYSIVKHNHKQTEETDTMSDKPYVLAIGDINTNAFIKMNEDHGKITTDEQGYTNLSIEMGGKIPYDEVEEFRAGECSPNAAVSMTRLGLKVDLMTWLGDDESGKHMIEYLKEQGVGTDCMVVEEGQKSNYHYVLRFGADRTKLQKFENYRYEWIEPATAPDWIYLGVLGEDTWHLHEAILEYMDRNPSVKLIFQPGMYHLMWGADKLSEFYKRAELVVMNREEAAQVTGADRSDLHGLIKGLHDLGVSIAVVTDGPEGAYASGGSKTLFMPNYPDPAPPFERTGAGDAFASTLSAALALGEPLESALRWAPINSAYVVQQMGAQRGLLKFDELQSHLEQAPDWYHSKEFEG